MDKESGSERDADPVERGAAQRFAAIADETTRGAHGGGRALAIDEAPFVMGIVHVSQTIPLGKFGKLRRPAVRVSGRLICNSGETLRRAALDGIGIALAAGFLVHDDLESGRLVRLLPEYRPIEFAMIAVYPHRHHLSAKVRTFIDRLAHHAAEQQKLINPYA